VGQAGTMMELSTIVAVKTDAVAAATATC